MTLHVWHQHSGTGSTHCNLEDLLGNDRLDIVGAIKTVDAVDSECTTLHTQSCLVIV